MTVEVLADSTQETMGAALAAVQEMGDGAMALFAEMHREWHKVSRETLAASLPWPTAEGLAQVA